MVIILLYVVYARTCPSVDVATSLLNGLALNGRDLSRPHFILIRGMTPEVRNCNVKVMVGQTASRDIIQMVGRSVFQTVVCSGHGFPEDRVIQAARYTFGKMVINRLTATNANAVKHQIAE